MCKTTYQKGWSKITLFCLIVVEGLKLSIYATVRCRCYELGHYTPPPYALDVYQDEGGYPALGLPQNEHTHEAFAEFREWLRSACEHPNMHYANVRIASGAGYMNLLVALDEFGWEKLPTLRNLLPWPQDNFRPMKPSAARKALRELQYFRENADFGQNSFIVDSDSGIVINEFQPDKEGALHTINMDEHNNTRIAFNSRGVYIIEKPNGNRRGRVVFQAKRLEQRLLEPAATTLEHERRVEYTNLNTGRKWVCATPIAKAIWGDDAKIHYMYPRYLHVEERKRDGSYFDYVLEPLTDVLRTAIEIGNPIVWHEG
jgi:hypothetical protein